MPRAPILSREAYYAKIHGSHSSPHQMDWERLQWNVVQTEQGVMVEPINSIIISFEQSKIINVDSQDNSFNQVRLLDGHGEFQNIFGTGGAHCIDY